MYWCAGAGPLPGRYGGPPHHASRRGAKSSIRSATSAGSTDRSTSTLRALGKYDDDRRRPRQPVMDVPRDRSAAGGLRVRRRPAGCASTAAACSSTSRRRADRRATCVVDLEHQRPGVARRRHQRRTWASAQGITVVDAPRLRSSRPATRRWRRRGDYDAALASYRRIDAAIAATRPRWAPSIPGPARPPVAIPPRRPPRASCCASPTTRPR